MASERRLSQYLDVRKPNRQFVMANGDVIRRDVGYALLKVNGFETVDEVVFAEAGELNLLGARTLEGFASNHRCG